MSRQAIAEARRIEHPFCLGFAFTLATVLARKLKQPAAVKLLADETIQLVQLYNFPLWNIVATLDLGWALVKEGQTEGLAKIQQSKQSMHAVMSGIRLIALETQAEICFKQALSISRRQQAKLFELRATKSLAKLWFKNGKAEEAQAC